MLLLRIQRLALFFWIINYAWADIDVSVDLIWKQKEATPGSYIKFDIVIQRTKPLDLEALKKDFLWSDQNCIFVAHKSEWNGNSFIEKFSYQLLAKVPGDLLLESMIKEAILDESSVELVLPESNLEIFTHLSQDHILLNRPKSEWEEEHFLLRSNLEASVPVKDAVLVKVLILKSMIVGALILFYYTRLKKK